MKLNEVCEGCGLKCTKDLKTGPGSYADPCLGILPGVLFSCCGHGDDTGYIYFKNGAIVRFEGDTAQVEKNILNPYHRYNENTTGDKKNPASNKNK